MAFTFPRREPSALFFPTRHVHDGDSVPERAAFDHTLYCQATGVLGATLDWTPSSGRLGSHLRGDLVSGLVDLEEGGFRCSMVTDAANTDVVLAPPQGVSVDDLYGAGPEYTFRVRATLAYGHEPTDPPRELTARTRLPALCRALREGLPALCDTHREAWHLADLEGLAPHFLNGDALRRGTTYRDSAPAEPGSPGRLTLNISTSNVESQAITLGFSRLPDPKTLRVILRELTQVIRRAV